LDKLLLLHCIGKLLHWILYWINYCYYIVLENYCYYIVLELHFYVVLDVMYVVITLYWNYILELHFYVVLDVFGCHVLEMNWKQS
jgi:hypothetical protein